MAPKGQIALAGATVYGAAVALEPDRWVPALIWHACWVLMGFPVALLAMRFLDSGEKAVLKRLADRILAGIGTRS